MKEKIFDLAVAYRIYPQISSRAEPPVFSENKFKLAELCLRSFKKSLNDIKAKIWVLLEDVLQSMKNYLKNALMNKS